MALIACSECGEEVSERASSCPHCGNPFAASLAAPRTREAHCLKCNIALVPVQRKDSISAGGCFGALLFLVGLVTLFGNAIIGVLLMILGVLMGTAMRGSKTVMVCPQCGAASRAIAG